MQYLENEPLNVLKLIAGRIYAKYATKHYATNTVVTCHIKQNGSRDIHTADDSLEVEGASGMTSKLPQK